MSDLKNGTRIRIIKTDYDTKYEPFLSNGNEGVIVHVDPTDQLPALYVVVLDNDFYKSEWSFWHGQIEEIV